MTEERSRLVRESFELLRENAVPIAMLFYGKLFELDPEARRLFHIDLTRQGQKLMDTLGIIIGSLDHFEAIQPFLAELGLRHANLGVRPEQYDTLREALLWTLSQALGLNFDAETRAAWDEAIQKINAAMLRA
jgi:nitric oxide dioxygenase